MRLPIFGFFVMTGMMTETEEASRGDRRAGGARIGKAQGGSRGQRRSEREERDTPPDRQRHELSTTW